MRRLLSLLALTGLLAATSVRAEPRYEDRYAANGDVRLHYRAAGKGPLVVMLHGFPEYWGFYRGLMDELDDTHRVAALSLGATTAPTSRPASRPTRCRSWCATWRL